MVDKQCACGKPFRAAGHTKCSTCRTTITERTCKCGSIFRHRTETRCRPCSRPITERECACGRRFRARAGRQCQPCRQPIRVRVCVQCPRSFRHRGALVCDMCRKTPESHRAARARRRQREAVDMTSQDRRESTEWRELIANDPCAYCGGPGEHDDHVVPLARGGTDHWWNIARACSACNLSKGSKTLDEWRSLRRNGGAA